MNLQRLLKGWITYGGALEIPMPVEFHVNQMKRELEEVSDKLKRIYVEEEDENPWEE